MEKNIPQSIKKEEKSIAQKDAINTTQALKQAEKDIKKDLDFKPDPEADLDEGELAKFEGGK
ncbi:MAG: hypothetical protein ACR2KX_04840 [Chitinophagaceae bacterium]